MSEVEVRDYWWTKLSGEVLDELFEEAKTCGHEGSCWDLVNMLADKLTAPTQSLLDQQVTKGKLEELKLVDDLLPNLWTPPYRSYKVEDMVKIEKHISKRADELQQQLKESE